MLKALKENKEYTITEEQKAFYLDDGFDIYEDGELLENSPKKKIEYGKYAAVKKELNEVKERYESVGKELNDLIAENDKLKKELEKLKKAGA